MDWKEALSKVYDKVDKVSDLDSAEISTVDDKKVFTEKLKVSIDKKGRAGKTATIIEGFQCDDEQLKEIAHTLKTKIGTGGSARGGEILLQGAWKDKTVALLIEMGFKAKGI